MQIGRRHRRETRHGRKRDRSGEGWVLGGESGDGQRRPETQLDDRLQDVLRDGNGSYAVGGGKGAAAFADFEFVDAAIDNKDATFLLPIREIVVASAEVVVGASLRRLDSR